MNFLLSMAMKPSSSVHHPPSQTCSVANTNGVAGAVTLCRHLHPTSSPQTPTRCRKCFIHIYEVNRSRWRGRQCHLGQAAEAGFASR
ncbi:hypothetical protein SLA2020_034150 [Shorea laevis]